MTGSVEGWSFLNAQRRLAHASGVEVRAGQKLVHEGPLIVGKSGLHASKRAIDALRFARGPVVARVRLQGEIVEAPDQLCASERTTLWLADASEVIARFLAHAVERAARDSAPELAGVGASAASELADLARERVLALDDALRDAQWRAGTARTDRVESLSREVGLARARVAALEAHERAMRDGALAAHGVCEAAARAIAWNVAREAAGATWDGAYADAWNELAETLEQDLLMLGVTAAAEWPLLPSEEVVLHDAKGVTTGQTMRLADQPRDPPSPVAEPPLEPAPPVSELAVSSIELAQAEAIPANLGEYRVYAQCPDCRRVVRPGWVDASKYVCPDCGRVGLEGPPRMGVLSAIRGVLERVRGQK